MHKKVSFEQLLLPFRLFRVLDALYRYDYFCMISIIFAHISVENDRLSIFFEAVLLYIVIFNLSLCGK